MIETEQEPSTKLVQSGEERPELDYKTGKLDIRGNDAAAALAKDVIAFANSGGGHIVIGRSQRPDNTFDMDGVPEEVLSQWEVTKLNNAVQRYMDPAQSVQPSVVSLDGKKYVVLRIEPSEDVALAAKENDAAKIRLGRIYVRSAACESREAQTSDEVRPVIERLVRVGLEEAFKLTAHRPASP